VDAGFLRDRAL